MATISARDRANGMQTKKGGSRSHRPFEPRFPVIPARRKATNPDLEIPGAMLTHRPE
jgi:hypothetical protein